MRNQFFLFTVLAVICWTGRGDQNNIINPLRTTNQREGSTEPGNDFYLDDEDEGADIGSGYYSDEDSWDSSLSSYNGHIDSSYDSYGEISGDGSDTEIVAGSMHLMMLFNDEYYNSNSADYQRLEDLFKLVVRETMMMSPLRQNYVGIEVIGFRPGSVIVDFEIEIYSLGGPVAEDSVAQVLKHAILEENFDQLSPDVTSLIIKSKSDTDMMTPTTTPDNVSPEDSKNKSHVPYHPPNDNDDPTYRTNNPDIKKTKGILDMILGNPIIIAAIVGGLIVILLSLILMFLFVVYRLKKKDEGSYSLDEPAKSKDPTAYWKETKEFYA